MRLIVVFIIVINLSTTICAQEKTVTPRPLTMEEYEKARAFSVKDLDNDSYVKFDNTYILDRYEMRKPYFITGDDGLKKRIDLYKLIAKDSLQELGLMIYYTTEQGKRYQALLPNFTAAGNVWEKYFEDIHSIDKEEKNFVLKLSYILSREMGFQLYKAVNQDKDLSEESATYGNDICFSGNQDVVLNNGLKKPIQDIQPGDRLTAVDPVTQQTMTITVKKLVVHEAKNYALTRFLLAFATKQATPAGTFLQLTTKELEVTPNHPMYTVGGNCKAREVTIGDRLLCYDKPTESCIPYQVINKTLYAGSPQKVYNIETEDGNSFLVNGVMVLQKE